MTQSLLSTILIPFIVGSANQAPTERSAEQLQEFESHIVPHAAIKHNVRHIALEPDFGLSALAHVEIQMKHEDASYTKKSIAETLSIISTRLYLLWTRCFPLVPTESKPFKDSQPAICKTFVHCNDVRLGLGRRWIVSTWAFATITPLSVACLIIFCSSMRPRARGKLNIMLLRAFLAMLVSAALAIYVGDLCYNVSAQPFSTWVLLLVTLLCLTSTIVATFWLIDVEFDWPHLYASSYLQAVSIWCVFCMVFVWYALVYLGACMKPIGIPPVVERMRIDLTQACTVFASALIPRNFAFTLWLFVMLRMYVITFYFWDDTTGEPLFQSFSWSFPVFFVMLVFSMISFCIPYSRDRYFVAAFGCLILMTLKVGLNNRTDIDMLVKPWIITAETWFRLFEVVAISFACCLAMRYQIVLPDKLQNVRYVRLGYLYETFQMRQKITRCQELPDSAFGNTAKVMYIIIISHHWLDGHTCDMVTSECPQGLRLTTLCQRLEQFFPTKWPGLSAFCRQPMSTISKALTSASYYSHDCLLFFDFMSLPQIGMLPDGTLLQRSAEDKALFESTLPACGLLYTMFPVMVCPEIVEGITPYMSSGWCFCEWEQAQLCGTLSPYSEDPEEHGKLDSLVLSRRADDGSPSNLVDTIEEELKKKLFRCEDDREIVRGIVRGTWIRRELVTAVQDQNAQRVRDLLTELEDHGLTNTISFPVDSSSLDSLLHIAMKLQSSEIQAALINSGADPTRPNHRGEEPGKFLLFPRLWFPWLN